jgi:hypothetical protein
MGVVTSLHGTWIMPVTAAKIIDMAVILTREPGDAAAIDHLGREPEEQRHRATACPVGISGGRTSDPLDAACTG